MNEDEKHGAILKQKYKPQCRIEESENRCDALHKKEKTTRKNNREEREDDEREREIERGR